MLEPDNTIHRPVYIEPPPHVDAGGINDANPRLPTTVVWKATTNGRKHRPGFTWNYTGTGCVPNAICVVVQKCLLI